MRNEVIEILRGAKDHFGAEIDRETWPIEEGKLVFTKANQEPHRGLANWIKNETNHQLAAFLHERYLSNGLVPQSMEEFIHSYLTRNLETK